MAWRYTGYGYDIEIGDEWRWVCYRTTSFSEGDCAGAGPSGQRPILLNPGEEWWAFHSFPYKSNLPWTVVLYNWMHKTPDPVTEPWPPGEAGGYTAYIINLPASSSWRTATVNGMKRYAFDPHVFPTLLPGGVLDIHRELVLGFYSDEYGLRWERDEDHMIARWIDGISNMGVFQNGAIWAQYKALEASFT